MKLVKLPQYHNGSYFCSELLHLNQSVVMTCLCLEREFVFKNLCAQKGGDNNVCTCSSY